jgi:hypothetical protein
VATERSEEDDEKLRHMALRRNTRRELEALGGALRASSRESHHDAWTG